jgi:hypothetical protein
MRYLKYLTNLKNIGNIPSGPRAAGGKLNGGGHITHFVIGTAIGSQLVK